MVQDKSHRADQPETPASDSPQPAGRPETELWESEPRERVEAQAWPASVDEGATALAAGLEAVPLEAGSLDAAPVAAETAEADSEEAPPLQAAGSRRKARAGSGRTVGPEPGSEEGTAATAALQSLSLPARLEAILYLKGRPLPLAELAAIAGIGRQEAELALITLMTDYAHRDTALEIHQEGQTYSLQLRESLGDLVQSLLPVDLSTAALRTLATIALRTRILQSELVELRGSGAYDHIRELLAQEFIERRRQSDGRSYWLSLSEKFHRTFAIQGQESLGRPRRRPSTAAAAGEDVEETRPLAGDATDARADSSHSPSSSESTKASEDAGAA